MRLALITFLLLSLNACSATRSTLGLGCDYELVQVEGEAQAQAQAELKTFNPLDAAKMEPEERNEALKKAGRQFAYGHGMGQTAANVGGVIIFPPYGILLLGNAVASFAGYEPLEVSELLPGKLCRSYNKFYDNVVSVPGRITAGIAGEDFIERERGARVKADHRDSSQAEE